MYAKAAMHRCVKAIGFSLMLLFIFRPNASAFPIEPVFLRSLIEESDLIVFAKVEPPAKPKDDFRVSLLGESPARLRSLEVIKGTAPSGMIEVHFNPHMVCPSPPRFPADTNVLAFLVPDPRSGGFRTVALDYGAKLLKPDEAAAYMRHIREYLAFAGEKDAETKILKTTEWLVQCVEDPHTRHEGAADLVDRRSYLNRPLTNHFGQYLTASQLARLSNVVFNAEFLGFGERLLIPLFKESAKTQLIQIQLSYVRKAAVMHPPIIRDASAFPRPDDDSFPDGWCVFRAMESLAELLDCPEAKAMLNRNDFVSFGNALPRITAVSKFMPVIEKAAREKGISLE
jgi:hypothetical protein